VLNKVKGFKVLEALKITFVRRKDDALIPKNDYLNRWQHIVLTSTDFIPSLELSQGKIMIELI